MTSLNEEPQLSSEDEKPLLEVTRSMAAQALAISVVDWPDVGTSPLKEGSSTTATASEIQFDVAAEHITALFLVRLAAHVDSDEQPHTYSDLSTSTICRSTLLEGEAWTFLTQELVEQVREYVTSILRAYRDLPFHNYQHAYHVVVTANKLMDLMLSRSATPASSSSTNNNNTDGTSNTALPPLFGLRRDGTLLMGILFAALIHDADHRGVTNRQLSREGDPLALLYNDQSMQEHQSLKLAFETLLDPSSFDALRLCMFPTDAAFQRFRQFVIDMVLSTDIANPERAQISKSKWKEAFGGEVEAGLVGYTKNHGRRSSLVSEISMPRIADHHHKHHRSNMHRRMSNMSTNSMVSDVTSDSYIMMMKSRKAGGGLHNHPVRSRMMSNESDYDSVAMYHYQRNDGGDAAELANVTRPWSKPSRRASNQSLESYRSDKDNDSFALYHRNGIKDRNGIRQKPHRNRLPSYHSSDDSLSYDDYGNDSVHGSHIRDNSNGLHPQRRSSTTPKRNVSRRWSTQSYHSNTSSSGGAMQSIAAESIALARKRVGGQQVSRHRNLTGPNTNYEYEYDDEDDSSLSLTPPSSEDEMDGVVLTGLTLSSSNHAKLPIEGGAIVIAHKKKSPQLPPAKRELSRRASTGNFPSRFGTLNGQVIDEHCASKSIDEFGGDGNPRYDGNSYRKRLGIRRSMDLSGEQIEVYSRQGSIGGLSTFSRENIPSNQEMNDYDEPDDLKASVVAELILRISDVGHNFQKWETMIGWMSRMFKEMVEAHKADRGLDPRHGWFDNQVRIIESYLLPLTSQFLDTGVLAAAPGSSLIAALEDNHDTWMVEGFDVCGALLEGLARVKYQTKYEAT